MSIRKARCLWTAGLLLAGSAAAQTPRITSFDRDGLLTWQHNDLDVSYRVQKAPSPVEYWRSISGDLNDLPGTGTTMRATIPLDSAGMCLLRVRATPGTADMGLVPGGSFDMGDHWEVGEMDEIPVHPVIVSGFLMDKYEVTNGDMANILTSAFRSGKVSASTSTVSNTEGTPQQLLDLDSISCPITFSSTLRMFLVIGPDRYEPCGEVTWYGAQAYCNYRSDEEGLDRCINFLNWSCDFSKKGYRLPTEAEWEKAARGGIRGQYYPWPSDGGNPEDHLDKAKANYDNNFFGPKPVGYYDGNQTPSGTDMANGYGLYDMAGNIGKWCYDRYDYYWYESPDADEPNTTGPTTGSLRVHRVGSYVGTPMRLRCAERNGHDPMSPTSYLGFRCVRRP